MMHDFLDIGDGWHQCNGCKMRLHLSEMTVDAMLRLQAQGCEGVKPTRHVYSIGSRFVGFINRDEITPLDTPAQDNGDALIDAWLKETGDK